MTLRDFRATDVEILIDLFRNTVHKINSKDYSPEQIQAWAPAQIDPESWRERLGKSFTYVVVEGSVIVGFANVEANGHIDLFYVHAEWQGKGVGRKLLQRIESKAHELQLEKLFAEVSITARPFFQSQGYSVEREQTVSIRSATFTNFVMSKARAVRGQTIDWKPTLMGSLIRLRPLREEDFEPLFAVGSDPLIWEQHPERDRYTLEKFRKFFRQGLESSGAFAILDLKTGEIIGSSRYTTERNDDRAIEIGYTFLARKYWGKGHNRELKSLMLDYAFRFVETVYFYVGETNFRSQSAMRKIGAKEIDRVTTTQLDGSVRTSVVYQMKRPPQVSP